MEKNYELNNIFITCNECGHNVLEYDCPSEECENCGNHELQYEYEFQCFECGSFYYSYNEDEPCC